MKKRNLGIRTMAMVCAVLMLAAALCAGAGAEGKNYVIGLSNSFTGNIWRSLFNASLEQKAAEYDNVTLIELDGQNDINKQVSDIENLISQQVDAIIVIPGSTAAVQPVLKDARAQGILTATCTIILDDPDAYDLFVGPNMKEGAELCTRWLFEKMGGKGNIVQLGGTPGNNQTGQWLEVCQELIDTEYPDINILAYKDTDWKEDTAKQVMTDLLLAYPGQIDGVWCDGAQSAGGAMKAYADAGVPMPCFTGYSVYNSIFATYLAYKDTNPDLDFCVGANPIQTGSLALGYLIDKLEGKEVDKIMYAETKLFTGENAEELYNPDLPDAMIMDHDLTPENLEKLLENSSVFGK